MTMKVLLERFRPDDDRAGAPDWGTGTAYLYRVIVEQPPASQTTTWYSTLALAGTAIAAITEIPGSL